MTNTVFIDIGALRVGILISNFASTSKPELSGFSLTANVPFWGAYRSSREQGPIL